MTSLKLAELQNTWHAYQPNAPGPSAANQRRKASPETVLRLAREAADRDLPAVRDPEVELDVKQQWTSSSEEWKAAAVSGTEAVPALSR